MNNLTAKEYFEIKKRMTKSGVYWCQISCDDCPLSISNNKRNLICSIFETDYPDEAMAIAEKWNKKHPPITNAQHYTKELKKLRYHVDVNYVKRTCPAYKCSYYVEGRICIDADDCDECRKWWDEEYIPSDEKKGENK